MPEGMHVPSILAVANQKGGVGKTTTATTLAHALGLAGRRVLVVDVDPQANATSGMGLEAVDASPAFTFGADGSIVRTSWEGVSCLPAGRDLEHWATQRNLVSTRLRENLGRLETGRFDVVFVDCPPSLGPLTQNALAAAGAVLIPIQCEYYPLEGLVQLIGAVRLAAERNPSLRIGGVLLTMYDPETDLSQEVEDEVRGKLDEPVFEVVIPRDTAVAEAPSHCLSVIEYAPRSRGARAYVSLAAEMIARGLVG
jgi:chromosome partitioning protein